MNKKLISILLVCTLLFAFAGCGKEKGGSEEKPDNNSFTINGLTFELDEETSFEGLYYSITGDFRAIDHYEFIPYIQYDYRQEDGSNLLFFRVFYYEGKDVSYALGDLGIDKSITFEDGKNDDVEYKLYKEPRDDGGTMHYYFLRHGDNTYVVNFVSKYDISGFEDKVVKTLHF